MDHESVYTTLLTVVIFGGCKYRGLALDFLKVRMLFLDKVPVLSVSLEMVSLFHLCFLQNLRKGNLKDSLCMYLGGESYQNQGMGLFGREKAACTRFPVTSLVDRQTIARG